MRVAVLVHNDVLKDARVRKEVHTLVTAGHEVDVFGLTKSTRDKTYPQTIDGSRSLRLAETSSPKTTFFKRIYLNTRKLTRLFIIVISATILIFAGIHTLVHGIAFALPAAMLLVNELAGRENSKKMRLFRNAGPAATAILIALLLRLLSALNLVDWNTSAVLIALTAMLWYLPVRLSAIQRRLGSLLAKFSTRSQATAREMRFRQMASILKASVGSARYDIIHCHDIIALIAGAALKKKNPGAKLFWDAHEIYEDLAQGNAELGLLNRKIILEHQGAVDGFITINESFAKFYGRNYKLPDARVVMNATRYLEPARDDGTLRAAAGLSADRKILLYQGGFARQRGLDKLSEAARTLPDPWSIVMMGWGDLESELRTLAEDLRRGSPAEKAPLVLLPPAPQEELSKWTAGAALGIIPYENTGQNHLYCTPNKLWEFPNAGVPILATDLVEMGSMVRAWNTGFLLPRQFSAQDILNFLKNFDQDVWMKKKESCLAFSQEMSWKKFEPVLLSLYENNSAVPGTKEYA